MLGFNSMDFNVKQRRNDDSGEEGSSAAKQPRLLLHNPAPLSLSSSACTKYPKMGSSNGYFSFAQWQELELQALIFRHMIAGDTVPPHLLHLVCTKTPPPPLYYQYYPHYHQPSSSSSTLVQSGYWVKGAMDPEPGRCRRTDGKKWRCSRDVVAAQKYCERHMHRGRNRSRKHVEIPTSPAPPPPPHFTLSGPPLDLHLNRTRPLDSISETQCTFESQNDAHTDSGGRTLRRFFDDWPRSLHETDNATNLSISTPGSDFSLKLGTGNGDESRTNGERDRPQLNWGMTWENNRLAPMGGPLAEALRSSVSTSSPTSVLHRLARTSASENSYVST